MKRIGVLDSQNGNIIKILEKSLPKDCLIEKASRNKTYDILVLKQADEKETEGISAKYAVLFPEVRLTLPFNVKYALNCGSRETDTLTLSSFFSNAGIASLRREIVSINGKTKEPCEIELEAEGDIDEKLALAAVKIIFDLI